VLIISPELITRFHLDMKFKSLREFYLYLKSEFFFLKWNGRLCITSHFSVAVLAHITILKMVGHLCIAKICNVNSSVVRHKKC